MYLKSMNKIIFMMTFLAVSLNVHAFTTSIRSEKITASDYSGVFYYSNKLPPKAILVLYPTISGLSVLEKNIATYFARHQFLVLIPLPYKSEISHPTPDIDRLNAEYLKPVESVKLLINELETKNPDLNNLPLFAMGASQGGIRSLLLTANYPRVKAVWFSVAGGNFPKVYAHSEVEKISTFRERHKKVLNIVSNDDYENYLRKNLTDDPLLDCQKISVPLVQVIALKDTKVPTSTQEDLARACPPHKIIRINQGHVIGSLTNAIKKKEVLHFFQNNF